MTGYDVSKVGLAAAEASAAAAGLKIHTVLQNHNDFDFGVAKWDLIVMVFPGMSAE